MIRVHSTSKILFGLFALTLASSAAFAQAQRPSVGASTSEFRDPKTGQVWTPETVGRDGRPLAGPDDKAFNPKAQNVPVQSFDQRVRGRPVGKVPITAGPTVPIVNMDNASLRAVPGQRWQAVLYLDNNSGKPVDPVIECRFTNGGRDVWNTRATVDQMGPGVRQGLVISGPRVEVFVDRVTCTVAAP